jgi:hypothetical protein
MKITHLYLLQDYFFKLLLPTPLLIKQIDIMIQLIAVFPDLLLLLRNCFCQGGVHILQNLHVFHVVQENESYLGELTNYGTFKFPTSAFLIVLVKSSVNFSFKLLESSSSTKSDSER